MNDYPCDSELIKIKQFDIPDQTIELIDYIESIWHIPDWGIKKRECKNCLILELHTGGWSGNESIVNALETTFFWFFYWQKSVRGGHYYFKIPKE